MDGNSAKQVDSEVYGPTNETPYEARRQRLGLLFDAYRTIYGLPEYTHNDPDVLPQAFEYAKKRSFFVILVLHTVDGEVYFQRSFDSGHLSMNLPGASIRLQEEDSIITAIEKVAKQSVTKARIADIAPMISLRNHFTCVDGRTTDHIGLGIRALLLNDKEDITEADLYKGKFIDEFPSDHIPHPPAMETYKKFRQWFGTKQQFSFMNEIDTQHEVRRRYEIHRRYIKPLLMKCSHYVGACSIPEMKEEVIATVGSVNLCIDVACGDDHGVFDLLRNVKLLVANDISVDQINEMEKHYRVRYSEFPNSLLFTNHDCLDLPFKDKVFDVAFCRNTLHHMKNLSELGTLLNNMERVAQKIVIVEVEDPKVEGLWGHLRHQYYIKFLRDEGKRFYRREDFRKVLTEKYGRDNMKFRDFETIRGTYMMAEVASPRNR